MPSLRAVLQGIAVVCGNICILLVLCGSAELLLFLIYRYPPDSLVLLSRNFYSNHDRRVLQYEPQCSQYDSELGYRMRPGSCRFRNREFDTQFTINSMGLRDDEHSLLAPDVIVLGDSFTAGWGVEGEETFVSHIEKDSGLRVLNAGISSYGTARQMMLLSKLDLSNLKAVIIQYCNNDRRENMSFLAHKGSLPISSAKQYRAAVASFQRRNSRFRPLLFLRKYLPELRRFILHPATELSAEQLQQRGGEDVRFFLEVLRHYEEILRGRRILVFELSTEPRVAGAFTAALLNVQQNVETTNSALEVIDTRAILSLDRDFYRLDDHLHASGHQRLAKAVVAQLLKDPALRKY